MPDDETTTPPDAAPATITDATDAASTAATATAAVPDAPALPVLPTLPPAAPGMRDDAADAAALLTTIKGLPGVPKAIADLVTGTTPAEIHASLTAAQAMYTTMRAAVLAEFGEAVPGGHGGTGAAPPPATPFDAIRQGVDQQQRSNP